MPYVRATFKDTPAVWTYDERHDVWMWVEPGDEIVGTPATLDTLRQQGYQLLTPSQQRLAFIIRGQMGSVQFVRSLQGGLNYWATPEAIERAQATPVALAFSVPGQEELLAQTPLTLGAKRLPIVNVLPPPQIGEYGLIIPSDTETHRYTLSALNDDALALWQRMGKKITTLAGSSEWWLFTDAMKIAANPETLALARRQLHSQITASLNMAEREELRGQLHILDREYKRLQALFRTKTKHDKDAVAWDAAWEEITTMAYALATHYWAAHITQADYSAASIAIDEPITVDSDDRPPSMIDASGVVDAVPATPVLHASDPENAEDLARLARINESNSATHLLMGNFAEDEAVRKAAFRATDGKSWREDQGLMRYDHRSLGVYLGDPHHPMPLEEAQAKLREIRESAVLTMRIGMGLWNLRRYSQELAKNGAVAITATEILAWRGVKKHERLAHPGTTSTEKRTDGWDSREVDDVHRDLTLAEMFYLHGSHRVKVKGRYETLTVTSRYITVSPIRQKNLWGEELVGFYFSPGDWINAYDDKGVYFLTPADRRIFHLNPQNEQHEVRIALYLVERWRKQANDRAYSDPITMSELLAESVIPINEKNLTNRFAPRIESALVHLQQVGIIGEATCLTPVDKGKARWGKDWLAARWRITPPQDTLNALEEAVRGGNPASLPPGKPGKGK